MVKNPAANAGDRSDADSISELGRSPGVENGPTPVFLPGESHGQRSLAGYSPWGHRSTRLSTRTLLQQLFVL